MLSKIPLVAVSYLNTKPFLYGLERSALAARLDLQLLPPAFCAQALREGRALLGLVPVGALSDLGENWEIVGDFGIAARGRVRTVSLFAHSEVQDLRRVYLDYQSRTSVALLQLLMREYWRVSNVEFVPTQAGFEQAEYAKGEGVVIIGDRAVGQSARFGYEYDLSQAWQDWQGLPFVFAVWVGRKDWLGQQHSDFMAAFNAALAAGVQAREALAAAYEGQYAGTDFSVREYYTQNIRYELGTKERAGLAKFLQLLAPKADKIASL